MVTAVSAVALLGSALSPSAAAGQMAPRESGGDPARGVRGQVTLLSGDKVTVVERKAGVPTAFVQPEVVDQRDFTGGDDPGDAIGHGTHVASTIAGTGAKSGGKNKGVAPDAALLDAKVCGESGCSESTILAGMQWAVESGAKVVNMSLGGPDTEALDPLEEAVNQLSAQHDVLFVVAAGNSGPAGQTVASPAGADAALAVGAVDKEEQIARFSSRGPRVGDRAVKPEITAPGVAIAAAKAGGGGEPAPGGYVAMSGTSMAAPHVAGAAAVLVGQRPDLSSAQYKALLMGSAKPNPALGVAAQGAGRVDLQRATRQSTHAEPPALSLGTAVWPYQDDPRITKKLTYRNPGPQPVTFTLAVTATGPDGKPAPAGMFSLSTDRVTVPPGAAATVELTADTTLNSPDGDFSGHVTATAEVQAVVTPLAVHKEVESYDLSLSSVGRDGAASSFQAVLTNATTGEFIDVWSPDGRTTRRLPKADYHLTAAVVSSSWQPGDPVSLFLRPTSLAMTSDQSVALDARRAEPISVKIDKPGLTQTAAQISGAWTGGDQDDGVLTIARDFENMFTAQLGPDAPVSEFTAAIAGQYQAGTEPHNVAWTRTGGMFTGLDKVVSPREFAEVRNNYHLTRAGSMGLKVATPWLRELPVAWGLVSVVDQPGTRTEYYHGSDLTWSSAYVHVAGDHRSLSLENAATRYAPGRSYRESWNTAVFGPSLPSHLSTLSHNGNRIDASLSLISDAPDRLGRVVPDSGRTTLFRDGVKVGDSDWPGYGSWEVPAGMSTYRLESDLKQSVSDFSTHIQLTQTFRSHHTNTTTNLPTSTIRYSPAVDIDNRAQAGQLFRLPVQTQTQGGARVLRLDLSVSYDDGKTWQKAFTTPITPTKWTADLRHPTGPGFVSLKAKTTDHRGATTEQTIIRAYGLK
ncbi:S8 family serine peptidase [Saccharothrix sp. CCNWLW140]|uniref:S8 family serine peptidase n=1 Tax=Saccharothrix sp. CCNWLW140 TaxID=3128895 RepID=UPI00307EF923